MHLLVHYFFPGSKLVLCVCCVLCAVCAVCCMLCVAAVCCVLCAVCAVCCGLCTVYCVRALSAVCFVLSAVIFILRVVCCVMCDLSGVLCDECNAPVLCDLCFVLCSVLCVTCTASTRFGDAETNIKCEKDTPGREGRGAPELVPLGWLSLLLLRSLCTLFLPEPYHQAPKTTNFALFLVFLPAAARTRGPGD
jgi:hypothetical protein